MITSSNENIFRATGPLTRSFDVFLDLRPNKRLNKQSRYRWFETPSRCYDRIDITLGIWQTIAFATLTWLSGIHASMVNSFLKHILIAICVGALNANTICQVVIHSWGDGMKTYANKKCWDGTAIVSGLVLTGIKTLCIWLLCRAFQ